MTNLQRFRVCAVVVATVGIARTTVAEPQAQCPAFVRGSQLSVTNVDRGVAVRVITRQPQFVSPLRQMLRDAAQALEQQADASQAIPVTERTGAELPPIDIDVENVTGGARVTVRADRRGDVAAVRKEAHRVESFWQISRCVTETTAVR